MVNASGSNTLPVTHEPWCDPAEHALASSAFLDDHGDAIDTGCISAVVEVDDSEHLGGWWRQGRDRKPEFIVDRGFDIELSAGAMQLVEQMLSTSGGTERLRQLAQGAMTAHAGGVE